MARKIPVFVALVALGLAGGHAQARRKVKDPKAAQPAGAKAAPAAVTPPGAKGPAPAGDGAKAAGKPATYEDARADALPAGDLANLLEPLFAECPQKEDHARRQCEQIRAWHLERIKTHRFWAVADASALQFQPYDAAEKTLTVTVTGCVSCLHPPVVAGSPRIVATRAPKAMEEGIPVGLDLGFHEVSLPTAQKAAFWSEKVRPRLRVEFVFNVGQPFDAKPTKGVAIVPIAHRVYNACSGDVLGSDPPSKGSKALLATRDPVCPAVDAPTDEEIEIAKQQSTLPETLTREDIVNSMGPVQLRVYECGEEFELKQGTARVHVVLEGDGKHTINILPPFDKGDVHLCIRAALNDAKFPRFKSSSPPVNVDYPFVLRR